MRDAGSAAKWAEMGVVLPGNVQKRDSLTPKSVGLVVVTPTNLPL